MRKALQIAFGAIFVIVGIVMLIVIVRDGGQDGGTGQAALAPLGLMAAGALAISHARRPPKKW